MGSPPRVEFAGSPRKFAFTAHRIHTSLLSSAASKLPQPAAHRRMRWLSWALCCCLLIIAALLRKRGGTLRELRLAQPARTPTKFLVLMMKGRVGSVWLRDLLMANPEILVRHEGLPDQPTP